MKTILPFEKLLTIKKELARIEEIGVNKCNALIIHRSIKEMHMDITQKYIELILRDRLSVIGMPYKFVIDYDLISAN